MKTIINSPALKLYEKPFINFINNSDVSGQTLRGYSQDQYPGTYYKHDDIEYRFNGHGFRSDDFSAELASSNFLFAGCSQSLVLGLPQDLGWASVLNSKLGGDQFYNLALVQSPIDVIVYNVMRYVELFGKPKAIFILFPDFYRKMIVDDSQISTKWTAFEKDDLIVDIIEENLLRSFMGIKQLELLCDSNHIPLMYSSWQRITIEVMMKLKEQGMLKHCFDIENMDGVNPDEISKSNSKYRHYWDVARDNVHFGEFDNLCFANSFLKHWERREQH